MSLRLNISSRQRSSLERIIGSVNCYNTYSYSQQGSFVGLEVKRSGQVVVLSEGGDLGLVAVGEPLRLVFEELTVFFEVGLMVLRLSLFHQLHQGGRSRVRYFRIGVEHLDDAVDKYQDGVLNLPILLVQQLVAYLPTTKHMEMLKAIHAVHLRRLVRVFLPYFHTQFVVSALEVGVLLALKDDDPLTVIREVVWLGEDDCADRWFDLLFVLLLEGLECVFVLILEALDAQVQGHKIFYRVISMGNSLVVNHASQAISQSIVILSFVSIIFANNFTRMHKEGQLQPRGKVLSFNLPQIRPARSLPAIPPSRNFDLRLVNIHMPSYQPQKDKFLSQYFERQNRIKTQPSSQPSQERPLKTEPNLQTMKRPYKLGEKGMSGDRSKKWLQSAVPSSSKTRTDNLKQLSKQQFSSFLQSMKEKITQKALS